jgi:hypothetical protein
VAKTIFYAFDIDDDDAWLNVYVIVKNTTITKTREESEKSHKNMFSS